MTRYVVPSCWPMSCSVQMCGWLSAAIVRASRSKRARRSGSVLSSAGALDRDGAVEARVAGLVDLAHPTGAERGDDLVRAEASTLSESHRPSGAALRIAPSRVESSAGGRPRQDRVQCPGAHGLPVRVRWPSAFRRRKRQQEGRLAASITLRLGRGSGPSPFDSSGFVDVVYRIR